MRELMLQPSEGMAMAAYSGMRQLLQTGSAIGQTTQAASTSGAEENTLPLRIASIFIILTVTFLVMLPPMLMKRFRDPNMLLGRLTRAFGGGVVLTLALVSAPRMALHVAHRIPAFPQTTLFA